jgi:hypothetical protein
MTKQDERKAPAPATPGFDALVRVLKANRLRRERVAALEAAYMQGVAAGFEAGVRLAMRDEEPS